MVRPKIFVVTRGGGGSCFPLIPLSKLDQSDLRITEVKIGKMVALLSNSKVDKMSSKG